MGWRGFFSSCAIHSVGRTTLEHPEAPHTYLVGVNPDHAFPKEDAERPQVDGLPIASLRNDFGCQVPRRAAHGPGGAHAASHLLGKAKIAQDCVPIFTDENVLRLQIAVHDIVAVQVIEALGDTCQVEQTLVRREFSSRAPDARVDVSARVKVHGEVQAVVIFARTRQLTRSKEARAVGRDGQGGWKSTRGAGYV